MLSKVAEYPIVPFQAGTAVDPAYSPRASAGVWDDSVCGLITSNAAGDLFCIKPGGHAVFIGSREEFAGFGWSGDYDQITFLTGWGFWFRSRVLSTGPIDNQIRGPVAGTFTSFASVGSRALTFNDGYRVFYYGNDGTQGGLVEATIGPISSGPGTIFPANLANGKSEWWLCNLATGDLWLYDANAKAEIASGRTSVGSGADCVAYSRKHRLFVARRGMRLDYYASEPKAATLTIPTLSKPARVGEASTLSVRVLGSVGEPCAGRVVSFDVSNGTVQPASVETDATGTASTQFRAPFTPDAVIATATLLE